MTKTIEERTRHLYSRPQIIEAWRLDYNLRDRIRVSVR